MPRIGFPNPLDRPVKAPRKEIHIDCICTPRPTLVNAQRLANLDMDLSVVDWKKLPFLTQPDLHEETHAFQIQVKLSGKMMMQRVHATDLTQDLLQKLEHWLWIPSSYLKFLYKGKQLMNPLPLSFYSIHKDASIVATFRLRGGSFGQTSSAPSFSIKDAVHKEVAHPQSSPKVAQATVAPKPFLVDKSEEIPSINLSHPKIDNHY